MVFLPIPRRVPRPAVGAESSNAPSSPEVLAECDTRKAYVWARTYTRESANRKKECPFEDK